MCWLSDISSWNGPQLPVLTVLVLPSWLNSGTRMLIKEGLIFQRRHNICCVQTVNILFWIHNFYSVYF
jgi:hypothetical protein